MTIEIKRKKLEVIRLDASKAELEFNIEERLADIERLKTNIALNEKAREKACIELERLEGAADHG